mmetsp:Transcript_16722/g.47432  ORF Transcript_16722/g.47432 Transcript_16722/m.47432 type:complete len:219 (+) Transcript_16722:776-1432(+)
MSWPSTLLKMSPGSMGWLNSLCTCGFTPRTVGGDVHANWMPPIQSRPFPEIGSSSPGGDAIALEADLRTSFSKSLSTTPAARSKPKRPPADSAPSASRMPVRGPVKPNKVAPQSRSKISRRPRPATLCLSMVLSRSPGESGRPKCCWTSGLMSRTTGGEVHANWMPPIQSMPLPDFRSLAVGALARTLEADSRTASTNALPSRLNPKFLHSASSRRIS